jgi:DNA (cytosine-5)-methyltransferase 1
MTRPLIVDLFCGAGGAAVGYHRAGFDVVGVDIDPQPRYPYEFHQRDALDFLLDTKRRPYRLRHFAAIHASPPCQRWSDATGVSGVREDWPDLISPLRELLIGTGLPYVIENVEGSPLRDPVTLCGVMFPSELAVLRHRLFETNWPLPQPGHAPHPLVYTRDRRKAHYGKLDQDTSFVQVTGGGNCSVARAREAMGIDWMTKAELNEAIPPAYTEYVGWHLREHLGTLAT